jgi:hypothetical protein
MAFTKEQAREHLGDSSRALACLTANMVYDQPALLDVLVEVALDDQKFYSERASRVVSICSREFPKLFRPYCSRVVRELKNLRHEGPIRNFLKILGEVPLKLTRKD